MRAPFGGRPIADSTRRQNDRHDHRVVLLVLGCLGSLAYAWSDWMSRWPLPGIDWLTRRPGIGLLFEDGHFAEGIWITYTPTILGGDGERLLLLGTTALAFVLCYYLPVEHKKKPLVLLTLLLLGTVFGPTTVALLVACHLIAFATFHPRALSSRRTSFGSVSLAVCLWLPFAKLGWLAVALGTAATALAISFFFVRFYRPLLASPVGKYLPALVAHSSVLVLGASVAVHTATGQKAPFILGIVIFFWQWKRLIMYQIDLRHGRVPAELSPWEYFATFFTPAFLANFNLVDSIGKGYAYLNNSFLARDKNRIVLSGLSLLGSAFLFFIMRRPALALLRRGFAWVGATTYTSFEGLLDASVSGQSLSPLSVWSGLTHEFFAFYLLWSGVAHFKVGLWRLFGYDIEPYFQKPFLATNLLELWRRYAFYYREFLLQAFYYPVFFRLRGMNPTLRVFLATMAAIGFGHFVYGHMVEAFLYRGPTAENFLAQLRTAPFYLMFGLTLALTAVWFQIRGRRGRKPWAPSWRIGIDLLGMTATFGVFMVLRMFRPSLATYSFSDCAQLALAAFGR